MSRGEAREPGMCCSPRGTKGCGGTHGPARVGGPVLGSPLPTPGRFRCSREGLCSEQMAPLSCARGITTAEPLPSARAGDVGGDPKDVIFSCVNMVFVSLKDLCGAQV